MREVAVNNGLESARHALRGYTRIIYKIMSTGTQVSPDMLQADAFPDWGPNVAEVSEKLDLWRRALPPDTHHTTATSWEISTKTLVELYLIWHKTGALAMIAELDSSLHSLLEEVMEDLLDEEGYELS
jgi:heterodisulfide reductase subunit C